MRGFGTITILLLAAIGQAQTLEERLVSMAAEVRKAAVGEAAKLRGAERERVARALVEVMGSADRAAGNRAMASVLEWKPLEAWGPLRDQLDHKDSLVRLVACRTLGEIGKGDERTAVILGRELERGDRYHAVTAATALEAMGVKAAGALEAVGKALGHEYDLVRSAAARALTAMGVPEARFAGKLVELWRDESLTVRREAVRAVEAAGISALPALREALRSEDERTRMTAAWLVRKLKAPGTDLLAAGAVLEAVGAGKPEPEYRTEAQLSDALPPTEEYRSGMRLLAKLNIGAEGGRRLMATLHVGEERPSELRFYRLESKGWKMLRRMESLVDGEGSYDKPALFTVRGQQFVYVSMRISGTGAFHEDTIFWVTPQAEMEEVEFEPAPVAVSKKLAKGEGVWKGEVNTFEGTVMGFRLWIWKEGDGNCCPSGGEVTGSYQLTGRGWFDSGAKAWRNNFRIAAGAWQRKAVEQ
ncbi:MAG: HEAT repeat domain-containing protein [Bryobacterales bacterium]|nr:HEAT repeat domain-containing protein [Bryobacterales bacterium]